MALYYAASLTWKPLASSVLSSIQYLVQKREEDDITLMIESMDMATTVEMIDTVLHEIQFQSKSIQKSIDFVTESIKEVNRVLRHVELDVKNHHMKYFYQYRSLDLSMYKKPLETAFNKLKNRFVMLQQLLLIDHKINASSDHSSKITSS